MENAPDSTRVLSLAVVSLQAEVAGPGRVRVRTIGDVAIEFPLEVATCHRLSDAIADAARSSDPAKSVAEAITTLEQIGEGATAHNGDGESYQFGTPPDAFSTGRVQSGGNYVAIALWWKARISPARAPFVLRLAGDPRSVSVMLLSCAVKAQGELTGWEGAVAE